jgi:hypothetical protein
MIAACSHCGAANDVAAETREAICQKCGQRFDPVSVEEAVARRRAMWRILAAVIFLLLLLALLLLMPGRSGALNAARETVFGKSIAEQFAGNGEGGGSGSVAQGERNRGLGDNVPDIEATNNETSADASIGRAPQTLGARRPGDEARAGAAGIDEPNERVGNSRQGMMTNDASSGANPGNAMRNSSQTPAGVDMATGRSTGAEPGGLNSVDSRQPALLLDDFSERLKKAGARSGDVQVSLEWKNVNDLDLHVIDPNNEEIFYNHRHAASGGALDVDMNATAELTWRPVENVYWPERGAPKGSYRVVVVHYANHGSADPTPFTVRVINKGQASYYRGAVSYQPNTYRARANVCTFNVR